jgi:hypothetical protein
VKILILERGSLYAKRNRIHDPVETSRVIINSRQKTSNKRQQKVEHMLQKRSEHESMFSAIVRSEARETQIVNRKRFVGILILPTRTEEISGMRQQSTDNRQQTTEIRPPRHTADMRRQQSTGYRNQTAQPQNTDSRLCVFHAQNDIGQVRCG